VVNWDAGDKVAAAKSAAAIEHLIIAFNNLFLQKTGAH
jgi:hypothetical protein